MPARAWLWLTIALTAGAFTVAAALAPPASAAPGRGLAWVLFVGSSAHVASTGWLYTLGDVRSYAASRPLRLRWVPVALLLSGTLAAVLVPPARFAWLLLPFFGWQFLHFAKQNLGMVALAASCAAAAAWSGWPCWATWHCSAAPSWRGPHTCMARHPRSACCSVPTSVR